jgi:hypothetical protein
MMKKLLLLAVTLMWTMVASAQKLEIVDKDGNAVPYASVMTADATLVGVTGMDGTIADIGGAKTVVISHVAYQPKTVAVGTEGLKVKRDNKVKLSYDYLQQFERQHAIPALATEVLARMQELVDKD